MGRQQHLVSLLVRILDDREDRRQHIREFQEIVYDSSDTGDVWDSLHEIADILDLYEEKRSHRSESALYYGEDELRSEVLFGLRKLQRLGVRLQPEVSRHLSLIGTEGH